MSEADILSPSGAQSRSGPVWRGPAAAAIVVLVLPPLYALTGFGLFETVRSAGLAPGMQAQLFGAITVAGIGVLLWRAIRFGLSTFHLAGAGLLVASAVCVDWDYPAKFVHVPQYAVLGAILAVLLHRMSQGPATQAATGLLLVFAAFSDELVQGYLSARTFGLEDLAVDILAGGGGYLMVLRRTRYNSRTIGQDGVFLTCCVLPGIAAALLLVFICTRSSALGEAPPPAAFATLAAASSAAWIFVTLRLHRAATVGEQECLAACLGTVALGLVAFHGALFSLPLAFR